jgi:ribosomal protein S18 acetylase RimI-like enzyme
MSLQKQTKKKAYKQYHHHNMNTIKQVLSSNSHLFPNCFQLVPFTHEYYDETVQLISYTFVTREPLMGKKMTISTYSELIKLILKDVLNDSASEGLSFLLLDTQGKVCSFLISNDLSSEDSAEVEALLERPDFQLVNSVFHLLGKLQIQFRENHVVKPRDYLHFFLGGTDEKYENMGIGTKMRRIGIEVAKQQGFKGWNVEATNPITQKLWTEKFGGTVAATVIPSTDLNEEHRKILDHVCNIPDYRVLLVVGQFDK